MSEQAEKRVEVRSQIAIVMRVINEFKAIRDKFPSDHLYHQKAVAGIAFWQGARVQLGLIEAATYNEMEGEAV